MSFDLNIELRGNYILATATGIRSRDSFVAIAERILKACNEHEIDDIFFDTRELEGRISIFESYLLVAMDFGRLIKIRRVKRLAILDAEGNAQRLKFFESVCHKLDYDVRAFTEFEQAENWISSRVSVNTE